ncbi:Epimerase family protein [Luteitalea pratensis]|uniref:Epimerase family protein n=1 Tax=Luteitalea pratensis TaxID=1855912 RepID=A0A143PUU1_LUTPR|nr:TIGR01777 family oxidoreductase [Luteitalea pratensis]AMY11830.1 Epimerase family protein [Luteitalea pratensis]
MRVLIAGATGFIGRALIPRLQREGHSVMAWVRSETRARSMLGADVETVRADDGLDGLVPAIERCDAVVNLAGEPLLGRRWTAARRAILESSRLEVTGLLVRAIAEARTRPAVLVSGSAVGYYGNRADERLDEASSGGDDFLARLCRQWESVAQSAESLGVRVVLLRTGVVLGRAGGALARMQPPFELGLGGPLGSGRQYMPWIHLHDLVKIVAVTLVDERYRGPVNGVAPDEATSRAFARALGRALSRPAILPLPALALAVVFGEAHTVLLASQRVAPRALGDRQFAFDFPTLDGALEDIVGGARVTITPAQSQPEGAGEARYELQTTTVVHAPIEETFAFFSKAANLGLITPAAMAFSIQGQGPPMAQGARIDYHVRVGGLLVRWRTRITTWEPGRRFVDLQEAGPYRVWWHEHSFEADGERTVMEDRVYYAPPLGILGRLAHRFFIGPTLRKIFQYRGDVIRLRFGVS